MPETVKREYTAQSKKNPIHKGSKPATNFPPKFPSTPHSTDSNFEMTIGEQSKMKGKKM